MSHQKLDSLSGPAASPLPSGPSVLFCPADRPDRFEKALDRADAIIIDLEDAVDPNRKSFARTSLKDRLAGLPADRTLVRINPPRSAEGEADLAMLGDSGAQVVMIPKAENARDVEALAPLAVVALCETARGVQAAESIAEADNCVGLMWGGEDLTADIGGWSSRGTDNRYLPHVDFARSRILIAAAAARIAAWDGVYLNIADLDGLERECADAVAMGFAAKVAIHPSQTAVIRRVYAPTPEQLEWATRLLTIVEAQGTGVVNFEGRMVDGPLITMARRIADSHSSNH